MTSKSLYFFTLIGSFLLSGLLTPVVRWIAIKTNIYDHPSTAVKTHKEPVPYLGGVAIAIAFFISLIVIRFVTSFPNGVLRSLRGIFFGGTLIFLMGLADDIKRGGLHYAIKFMIQISAAFLLMSFGVRIRFINPPWLAYILTIIWLVGITNAFNIIDIMDGLSSGVGVVASLSFLFISLPTEEIYVNFAAVALAGAALGFIPYNLSKKRRIFMGIAEVCFWDSLAALSLGTSYSKVNEFGVFSPILILAIPIFDTCLVFFLRIKKGISPFLGSKDHFPLRLEKLGWTRPKILVFTLLLSLFFSSGAYLFPIFDTSLLMILICFYSLIIVMFVKYLLKVKVV